MIYYIKYMCVNGIMTNVSRKIIYDIGKDKIGGVSNMNVFYYVLLPPPPNKPTIK